MDLFWQTKAALNNKLVNQTDFYNNAGQNWGACGRLVVKALCYKPEGHGFEI
jgi:hypothetical protein